MSWEQVRLPGKWDYVPGRQKPRNQQHHCDDTEKPRKESKWVRIFPAFPPQHEVKRQRKKYVEVFLDRERPKMSVGSGRIALHEEDVMQEREEHHCSIFIY